MLGTCMYAYMYIHACICKRVHMCTHVRACVYVCTRVSDTCVHICVCVCTRVCSCTCVLDKCVHMCVYACACVCIHVRHVYACIRVHVCTCVYTHRAQTRLPLAATGPDAFRCCGPASTSTFESLLGISPLLPSLPLPLGPLPQAGPFTLAPAPTQGPAHHCSVNGVELMKDPTWNKTPKKQLSYAGRSLTLTCALSLPTQPPRTCFLLQRPVQPRLQVPPPLQPGHALPMSTGRREAEPRVPQKCSSSLYII